MRWTLGLLVTSLAASGCYQSHANSEGGLPDAAFLDGDPHGLDARRDAREDAFPPGACMRDDQCAPPIAACARARCFDVSCIVQEIPGACPLGSTCDFERGCVPRAEDGSVRDAFLPDAARTDVGFPDSAPFDAGFRDMGFPDMGFPDAARPDAGSPDAFVGDAGPPPTSSAIRCTSGTVLRALDHRSCMITPC